jgi:5-methylcytosine-specific restriction endonuclease McrA
MDSVIVLNRNYEFWTEASIHKVLTWFVQDKIEIVVTHETEEIGSLSFRIKMPLVVRLLNFVGFKPKSEKIPFSQEAVFHRDSNVCQYYHDWVLDKNGMMIPAKRHRYRCTAEDRTIDHVIPLCRKGTGDFRNCVCACRTCNEILKKNQTPTEAGLQLIRIPVVPHRNRDEFVVANFNYNPKKLAHKKYFEVVLGRSL